MLRGREVLNYEDISIFKLVLLGGMFGLNAGI